MTSCFYPVGERENSLPRYCFITLGTTLDNRELVLLAGENRCFPVSPTATPSHTRSPLCNPLEGPAREREGRKGGRKEGWGKEGKKGFEKQVWLQGGKTFCHRCQNPADCSFGHPNVLAIKFWENTLAHAHRLCKWKDTIICFWLLWNLLSCFQLYTPPPLHPSSPLQCFLPLKL